MCTLIGNSFAASPAVCSRPDVLDPIRRQQIEQLLVPSRSKLELKWLRVSPVLWTAVQVELSVFFTQDFNRGYAVGMTPKDRLHRYMERGLNAAHKQYYSIGPANMGFKSLDMRCSPSVPCSQSGPPVAANN